MSRGVARLPIFRDDEDRDSFLRMLERIVDEQGWKCLAYCLMTTHYHLVVETPEPNLASGMQRLNSFYAAFFNRRHGGRGHVFERRYHSVLVESDAHLTTLVGYLAANPIRAGLCLDPRQWRYGSYAVFVGAEPRSRFLDLRLLRQFHSDEGQAQRLLEAFVNDYALGSLAA